MPNATVRVRVPKSRIPRPFLKWAGGKTQLLPVLTANAPAFDGRYHEPFIGGGALFFELLPTEAIISDLNQELIDCYRTVRDDPDALIQALQKQKYDEHCYYAVRNKNPNRLSIVHRAARMIYLNKTGFNGLYRVNKRGEFNVPMGRYSNPRICDEEVIRGCSAALQGARIECRSFETVVDEAGPGDFVYFDPPYIPLSRSARFTAYEKSGFGPQNQQMLADVNRELTRKGVLVMLSNSDVPWIEEAYRGFRVQRVTASRNVNRDKNGRGPITEVLVTNY